MLDGRQSLLYGRDDEGEEVETHRFGSRLAVLLGALAAALTVVQAEDPAPLGDVILIGANPNDDPPEGAVAWMVENSAETPNRG